MSVFGVVDFSQDHCLITVKHPCTLMPLHRAPLGRGTYPIQGDVRSRLCRHVRERRMLSAGIFAIEFVQGRNLSARTESSPPTLTQDTTHETASPAPPTPTFDSPAPPRPLLGEAPVEADGQESSPEEDASPPSAEEAASKSEEFFVVVDDQAEPSYDEPLESNEVEVCPEPPLSSEELVEATPETPGDAVDVSPAPPAEASSRLVDIGGRVDQSTEEPLVEDPAAIFGESEGDFEPPPPPAPAPLPRRRRRKNRNAPPIDSE